MNRSLPAAATYSLHLFNPPPLLSKAFLLRQMNLNVQSKDAGASASSPSSSPHDALQLYELSPDAHPKMHAPNVSSGTLRLPKDGPVVQ